MTSVGVISNDDFFGVVDTPKEGNEQHRKRGCLKSVIDMGKENLLGYKWTYERVDKVSDKDINKTYAEYRQRKLYEKGEKTGKALGKYVINLLAKKLRQDIEDDSIIKDQMASLGCLFLCTFAKFLVPVLITTHTANNVDFGDEQEEKGYESVHKI